jgi:NAD(P)H-hydrate repair Nnr-like enzyme with NAD(P)H-hydrate dehydratase domain
MIVLIGTVPYQTGVYCGLIKLQQKTLTVGNGSFVIERGSAAMAASCAKVCEFYGLPAPQCIFGGDVSDGKGTDLMFQEVIRNLEKYNPTVITLHYLFPKMVYGLPLMRKINSLNPRPQIIADAGGMYLFKTVNQGFACDVFTPDEGELHFLADEFAPHPLYVRSELLKEKISRELLIQKAYQYKNTATTTVIKGRVDNIYFKGAKTHELALPNIPAMEAIGGTGDTITGMLTALRFKGEADSDYRALALNRLIGQQINCTPATQIYEFIEAIPKALEKYDAQKN